MQSKFIRSNASSIRGKTSSIGSDTSKFIRSNTSSGLLTYQELCSAASQGVEALENLIKNYKDKLGELLDIEHFSGNTIVHFAAAHNTDSLKFLIKRFDMK